MSQNHYKLKEGDTAYLIFNDFMITLDFFPGKPRLQIEDEEGNLVQEMNWNKEEKEFT